MGINWDKDFHTTERRGVEARSPGYSDPSCFRHLRGTAGGCRWRGDCAWKVKTAFRTAKEHLIGAAKRVGLPEDGEQDLAASHNVFEADMELVEFEAQLAVRRTEKRL